MPTLILFSCLLAFVQALLPVYLNYKNFGYLLTSRDEPIEDPVLVGRAKRAHSNLLESLPIFLVLAVLSIIIPAVDNYDLAMYWLGLRCIYVPLYVFNVTYIRSLSWTISIICLVLMAVSFI